MRVCARCGGKNEEGIEAGFVWFCKECCRRGFVCERCGRPVTVEDLKSGAALATEDGKVYCPRCMELVLPLFKALEDSRAAAPEVNPASSQMDAPPVEPASEDLPAPVVLPVTEQTRFSLRRPQYLLPIIAAVALVITVIIIVARSSPTPTKPPQPPRPDQATLKKRRLLAELQKKVNQILTHCKGGLDFELARISLDELRSKVLAGKYPVEGLADINNAARKIRLLEEGVAKKEYERVLAEIKRLEKQEEWEEAADAVDLFPSYLREAGSYWRLLEKRRERFLHLAEAKRTFLDTKRRVEEELHSPTADGVAALLGELKKTASQLANTPYHQKVERLISRLQEAQRKLKEARSNQAQKQRLQNLLATTPVVLFDANRPNQTTLLVRKFTACEFPFVVNLNGRDHCFVRFFKRDRSQMEFEFETVKSAYGAVVCHFLIPGVVGDKTSIEVSLNGVSRLFVLQKSTKATEIATLDMQIPKGRNTIKVVYKGGVVRPWLFRVAVHIDYDDKSRNEQNKLLVKRAAAIRTASRRAYEALKKEWDAGMRKWAQKFKIKPLPPLKVGRKTSLLDVRFWAARPDTGTKQKKGGLLLLKVPQNDECLFFPIFENYLRWSDYELVLEFKAKGKFALFTHTRYNPFTDDFDAGFKFVFDKVQLERLRALGWTRVVLTVSGRHIKWEITANGRRIHQGEGTTGRDWRGGFRFGLAAAGELEIRRCEVVLRKETK